MSPFCDVLYCSIIIWCYMCVADASDPTTTASFATISSDYHKIITDMFLPPGYVLPTNLYEWNVTEIVGFINEKDPELLYIIESDYLTLLFPEYFLRQLPRDILTTHHLYHLVPANDTLASNTTIRRFRTNSSIGIGSSSCLYPFVPTKHDSYFKWEFEDLNVSFECGLLCEYGDVLYGIRPEQQAITDWFNYICAFTFLFMLVVVFINQCMDHKLNENAQPCCHRGFMYHAPICIACFYAIVCICLLLPFFIDKENIVCAQDIDDNLTISLSNPGGSIVCTVIGSVFHTMLMLFGLYTLGFTFVLWRLFFAPVQSLWSRLSRYKLCCVCVCCVDRAIKPMIKPIVNCINARERYEKTVLRLQRSASSTGSLSPVTKKVTCFDIFCSNTTWAHYILFAIACTFTACAISEDIVDAFPPLGICTVGGRHEDQILKYTMIPFTVAFAGCTFFLPYAMYLLFQVTKYSTNVESKRIMRKLGARVLVYFVCMEVCWFFVCQTAWVFHFVRDEIMEAAETRMFCLTYRAATGDVDECYDGFALSIRIYIQMALTMPLAGLSSLGLSCHWKNRKRWRILCCTLCDYARCKGYTHEVALVTRMHVEETRDATSPKSGSADPRLKSFQFPSSGSRQNTSKPLDVPPRADMVLPSISRSCLEDIQRMSATITVTTTMETGPSGSQKIVMSSNSSAEVEMAANNDAEADAAVEDDNDNEDDDSDLEVP